MGRRKIFVLRCAECGTERHTPRIYCKVEGVFSTSHGDAVPIPTQCLFFDPKSQFNPVPNYTVLFEQVTGDASQSTPKVRKIEKIFPDKGSFREIFTILIDKVKGVIHIYNKLEKQDGEEWHLDHELGRITFNREQLLAIFSDITLFSDVTLTSKDETGEKVTYYWMSSQGELVEIKDEAEIRRIAELHQKNNLPSDVVFQKDE